MEGATSIIHDLGGNRVEKRYRRQKLQKANISREIGFHMEIADIISKNLTSLGVVVPRIFVSPIDSRYIMEKIDTSNPLSSQDFWDSLDPEKQRELEWRMRIFIKNFSSYGIFLKDVEAYYDTFNDLITVLDFGQVYRGEKTAEFKIESATLLPQSVIADNVIDHEVL